MDPFWQGLELHRGKPYVFRVPTAVKMLRSLSPCLLFAVLAVAGCSASERLRSDSVAEILRLQEHEWQGTPYVLGGNSRRGIDASGFVMRIFESAFGVILPRTMMEQLFVGEVVDHDDLQAGDLVFFQASPRDRHVGIYVSDNEFVHASHSGGVITSSLDEVFWKKNYWTARRVLGFDSDAAQAPKRPQPSLRTGW